MPRDGLYIYIIQPDIQGTRYAFFEILIMVVM